jgi:serine/threonine protein kinase
LDADEPGKLFAVITDFGIASVVDKNLLGVKAFQMSRQKGASIVYAAPEAIRRYRTHRSQWNAIDSDPEVLKAADMYSFGMILFELLSRKLPWFEYESVRDIEQAVMNEVRPRISLCDVMQNAQDSRVESLTNLMTSCWSHDPFMRPTAKIALKTFQKHREEERNFAYHDARDTYPLTIDSQT